MKNQDVCDIWAAKSLLEAKNSGNTLFFHLNTIYSYGYHFPIAKHQYTGTSEQVILFTTEDYSQTTRMHKSRVRRAIPNSATVIDVPIVKPEGYTDHMRNLEDLEQRALDLLAKSERARVHRASYFAEAYKIRASAIRYAKLFDVDLANAA